MFKIAVAIVSIFSFSLAHAASATHVERCAAYAVETTLLNGDGGYLADLASGDPKHIPVFAKNGRIVVNKKSPFMKTFDDSYPNKVKVSYNDRAVGLGSDLEFQYGANKQLTKAILNDKEKKEKTAWFFNGDCEVDRQEVNDKVVMYDKKFCEAAQKRLKHLGEDSLQKAAGSLADCNALNLVIENAYLDRNAEIKKEGRVLFGNEPKTNWRVSHMVMQCAVRYGQEQDVRPRLSEVMDNFVKEQTPDRKPKTAVQNIIRGTVDSDLKKGSTK